MGRGEERDYVEDKVVVRHLICVKKTVYFTRFERYSFFCLVGVKLGSALITPPVYHHHPHPPPPPCPFHSISSQRTKSHVHSTYEQRVGSALSLINFCRKDRMQFFESLLYDAEQRLLPGDKVGSSI